MDQLISLMWAGPGVNDKKFPVFTGLGFRYSWFSLFSVFEVPGFQYFQVCHSLTTSMIALLGTILSYRLSADLKTRSNQPIPSLLNIDMKYCL